LGAPRGPRGGPGGPCHSVLDPFVFDDLADPSDRFWSFPWAPPWDPPEAQIYIFPTFFNDFSADRGPKRSPLGPPVAFCAAPRAPPRPPKLLFFSPEASQGDPGRPQGNPRGRIQRIRATSSGQPSQNYVLPYVPCEKTSFLPNVAVAPVGSKHFRSKKGT